MIEKEKIKEASERFSLDRMSVITMGEKMRMRRYFTAGVKWCYGAMWHSINEMPEGKDAVRLLCITNERREVRPFYFVAEREDEWAEWVKRLNVMAWAYERDLIPAELMAKKGIRNPDAAGKFYVLNIGDIVTWKDGNGGDWIGRLEGKDVDMNMEFYPCISRNGEKCEWTRRSNLGSDTWTVNMTDVNKTLKSATEEQNEYGDSSAIDTFWTEVKRIYELTEEEG